MKPKCFSSDLTSSSVAGSPSASDRAALRSWTTRLTREIREPFTWKLPRRISSGQEPAIFRRPFGHLSRECQMLPPRLAVVAVQNPHRVRVQHRSRVLMQRLQRDSRLSRAGCLRHASPELIVARIAQSLIIERRDDERLPVRSQHDAAQFEWMLDTLDLRHEPDTRPVTNRRCHVRSKSCQLQERLFRHYG